MMNSYITNEWTSAVTKVVREIVSDPAKFMGVKYLPAVAIPVETVRTEVIEANGGLTMEHLPGTNPKYIESGGTRVQEYSPPFYKEAIHYDEKKILFLRKIGAGGDTAVRGVQAQMERDIDRLNRRVETRMEKQRWDTIFNGGFTWLGKTVSFGLPAANRAVPVGALWSLNGTSANPAADPITDLRYWLSGGLAQFRKYHVKGIVMNPNTARWILENTNTKSYLASWAANPGVRGYDLDNALGFLLPGMPQITVYAGWWQDETVDGTGRITVGATTYFIPDGYIFFETTLPDEDKIGEFVQTIHLASGTVADPGYGKFLVIDDCTAPGTPGGPKNPYVDIVAGVYGGVKLDRPFDLLTAKVVA